jgi:predicted metal-dependent hydrolase
VLAIDALDDQLTKKRQHRETEFFNRIGRFFPLSFRLRRSKKRGRSLLEDSPFGEPGIFCKIGARYRDWFRPTFHPCDHDNRAKLAEWRQQFG